MTHITFDYSKAIPHFGNYEVEFLTKSVKAIHEQMHSEQSIHRDSLGWIDYPQTFDRAEFARIQQTAQHIQETSEILLVIGIGGSYLGARAAIDMLTHPFKTSLPKTVRTKPQIIFVGQNLSSTYMTQVMDVLEGKNFSINVISKSGTTTEPAIAFRVFREVLEEKYGKTEASKRIYATTDATQGAMRQLSITEGYETFTIPEDIGGRYSVLMSVGLLPMAVAGIDIEKVMHGAKQAQKELMTSKLHNNSVYQ